MRVCVRARARVCVCAMDRSIICIFDMSHYPGSLFMQACSVCASVCVDWAYVHLMPVPMNIKRTFIVIILTLVMQLATLGSYLFKSSVVLLHRQEINLLIY